MQADWYFTLKRPKDCTEAEQKLGLTTGDYKGEEGGYQWDYIEKEDFIDWKNGIFDQQKQWHITADYLEKMVSHVDNQMAQLEQQKRKYRDIILQDYLKNSKRVCVCRIGNSDNLIQ